VIQRALLGEMLSTKTIQACTYRLKNPLLTILATGSGLFDHHQGIHFDKFQQI